ncbi:hypothetical protein CEXT_342801 [Caerostris extrusa]|uniref:Uncharacterized protein n=1 Tax=Caerostris extrusa TaxID=172846 RepID=A0AAV4PBG1_CAEEX|nr:hypothetical protein CEXT_342801 [Caerostris extrusa]
MGRRPFLPPSSPRLSVTVTDKLASPKQWEAGNERKKIHRDEKEDLCVGRGKKRTGLGDDLVCFHCCGCEWSSLVLLHSSYRIQFILFLLSVISWKERMG